MKRRAILLFLLFFATLIAAEQPNLQQQLPVDPKVRIGKLPNGMQYWIREHKTPPGKIGIWLHVGSGSLNEEENQRGLAHFLEHMSFNGSEHYPPGTLVKYYESIGLRFGQHQNAFTSFDQTTYILSLPDTNDETIRKGLETLADFAFRVSLLPEEIEKERNVILAEARARKGVGQRVMEKALTILLPGSRLANRLPIGTEEVVKKATREEFVAYYKKWYRPDNTTLLIVGDADPTKVETLVQKEFGDWKPVSSPPPDVDPGIQPYKTTHASVITDPELTTADVSAIQVSELKRVETVEQYRKELIEDLASTIVNRRLLALVEEGKAPYQSASVTVAPFQNKYVIHEAESEGPPEQWKPILTGLLTEVKRARDFGFLQQELEDARKSTLAEAEQSERTEATWDTNTFLTRMNSAISQGRKPMSESQSLEITKGLLPGITLKEVSDAFRQDFSAESRVLLITIPEKQGAKPPAEEEILAEAKTIESSTLKQQEQKSRIANLLEKEPEPGKIQDQQQEDADTKILSATFSNGARVHLRSMDFKKNSVSAVISFFGGEVRETEKNRGITQAASLAFDRPATSNYSSTSIREYMTGKNVNVSGSVDGDSLTITVEGSPQDFEEGLRLAYALFLAPKLEESALKVWQQESLQAIEQQKTSVEQQASEKEDELLSGGDPRLKSLTADQVNAIRLPDAQKWLGQILANAPIETAIVGDMDRNEMLRLAQKYFGSLPNRPRTDPELIKLRSVKTGNGPFEARIDVPTITPRAVVLTGWRGTNLSEVKDRRTLDLAAQILSSRMNEEIREKRGLTYSVRAVSQPASSYPDTGFFGTFFTADPEKVTEAEDVARKMILDFAEKGPTDAEMQTVRNQMKNIIETRQKEPSYWVSVLSEIDYRGIQLSDVKNLVPTITGYSKEDIVQTVRKYVQEPRRVQVIALPKK
jgi:zinc protease